MSVYFGRLVSINFMILHEVGINPIEPREKFYFFRLHLDFDGLFL